MDIEIESRDWAKLGPWWLSHAQSRSVTWGSASERALGTKQLTRTWNGFDPWWRVHTASSTVADGSTSVRALRREQLTDSWDDLNSWWDAYVKTGHETAVQIADLLEQSNDEWNDSHSQFDTDPLAADLTRRRVSRGPLQPNGEVDWSRWLAQILRPSAALVTELFDIAVDQAPSEVSREDQLSKQEGTFRRPDILVFHPDQGVSIEVKLDDENYRKTPETAALVEDEFIDRGWEHALLLPKRKKNRLESIVDPPLHRAPGGKLTVEWDDPGPIQVLYWCDVTAAIRSVLRRGKAIDNHWAANAYLFCAVAEQQIMDFQPELVIKEMACPENIVHTIQPISLAKTLEQQLTYLRETLDT